VVEGARLESVCRGNSTVGSNPTLSAKLANTTNRSVFWNFVAVLISKRPIASCPTFGGRTTNLCALCDLERVGEFESQTVSSAVVGAGMSSIPVTHRPGL
jgi:hypothetical protein